MMGRFSIIIYIAVSVLLFLLVSRSTDKPSHYHLRLQLRHNFTFKTPKTRHHGLVAFDPFVVELERRREERMWEKHFIDHSHPELVHSDEAGLGEDSQLKWEDIVDAEEDYLNDEINWLRLLFSKIDVDPEDGCVTKNELIEWNLQQTEKEMMRRTQREMEYHDKNRDGFVSFQEYKSSSWAQNADNSTFYYGMGWWKQAHFNASDANGDGFLNITELNDFVHPADSKNPKLLQWLCKEEVREHDSDKDGKVNFKEFFPRLFDFVNDESHVSSPLNEAAAKTLFSELDKNGDGYLTDDELLPVIGKINPSERSDAKQLADYTISLADSDGDGCLTLTEMTDNPYAFYSAVFNVKDDEGGYHDEFR